MTGKDSMGGIARQTRDEFKRLPLMLGKVIGGCATVIGSMVVVYALTRRGEISTTSLVVVVAGVILFMLSEQQLKKAAATLPHVERVALTRMNVLSWALLLLSGLVFLGTVYFLAR